MQSPLRAGLLSLVFSLILVLSAAAPIYPDNAFSSSSLSRHATTDSLAPVSSLNLVHNIARARHIVNEDGVAIRDTAAALNSRGFFDAIANGFKKLGGAIKNVVKKAGDGIKKVVQKAGGAVKTVVNKAKTVAKKVVNYVKTKGPEIGKVALKAASTAVEGASKFVQFIPVVGKPLSKVMDVGGKLLNKASNSIHTKVDGGVGNALNGMNKAQQVLKFIPRELAGSYHQRDVAALSERDLYELNAILARDTYSNSKNGLY